jgi:hypothetical protein
MSAQFTIIPALPGWFVAMFFVGASDGEDETIPNLRPIIAWNIKRSEDGTHEVQPLTTEGNHPAYDDWAIKHPDGRFEFHGGMFESGADVVEEIKFERDTPARMAAAEIRGREGKKSAEHR